MFTGLLSLGLAGAMAVLGDPAFELRLTHSRGLAPGAVDALAWTILAMGGGRIEPAGLRSSPASGAGVPGDGLVLYSLVGYPLLNDSSSARGLDAHGWYHGWARCRAWVVAWKSSTAAGRPPRSDLGFRTQLIAPRAGSGLRPNAVGCWSTSTQCCRASTAAALNWPA